MIQSVIFDMDGLLIDTEPFWQETEKMVFGKRGITITPEMQRATLGLRTDEQIRYWYNRYPWPDPDFKSMENEYDDLVLGFFKDGAKLMEGAEYILNLFSSSGLKMALASSSSMLLIDTFVDRFHLRKYFDLLYSAEHEDHGKPHPAVYLSTAALLSTHPSRCLAFEDSLIGLIAARAAMMQVVAVPDDDHFDDPGYGLAHIKLKNLLEFDLTLLDVLDGLYDK